MKLLTTYLEKFEAYLQYSNYDKRFTNLYEPIAYTLQNAGKRLRPLVVMMACEAYNNDSEPALAAATAIELFHNFTLLHDDIMDDAPTRRGEPSVYRKYGLNSAILSGDVMLIQSYDSLDSYSPQLYKRLMRIINFNAIKVCEGQQLDIDFETRNDVEISEYILMIELKTAVLIAGALQIGAIVGGASEEDAQHLYEFGKNIGIAFQLQDDYLDTYGNNPKVGKQKGGDIIQHKKTYLYLKTLELLEGQAQKDFEELYNSDSADKVGRVIEAFDSVFIKEYTDQLKSAYLDLAYSHLDSAGLQADKKEVFKEFARFLLEREY